MQAREIKELLGAAAENLLVSRSKEGANSDGRDQNADDENDWTDSDDDEEHASRESKASDENILKKGLSLKTMSLIARNVTHSRVAVVPMDAAPKHDEVPQSAWSEAYLTGFLRPVLQVVKEFLEKEIVHSMQHLGLQTESTRNLVDGFQDIYTSISARFVESDEDLGAFCEVWTLPVYVTHGIV